MMSRRQAFAQNPRLLAGMSNIAKRFGKTAVLKNVRLDLWSGEVHVLAGENGAGKSTLIKILAGVHAEFEGRIEIGGREARPQSPLEANAPGIAVIHQELSLIGPMSVADNIFLGRMPARPGFIQAAAKRAMAVRLLHPLGLDINVDQPAEQFPIAIQQLVETAKALSQKAQVIIMDEPASALNAPEVERLFTLIQSLKRQGCGIVYISHKMEEIERLAGRIAKDIHDDLGSSLTRIMMLGERAHEDRATPGELAKHLGKIVACARDTVQSLDEIVWAVDPENDTLDGLVAYISQSANQYFENTSIHCRLEMPVEVSAVQLSAEVRHDIFLAVKEALNNILKHSRATAARVQISADGAALKIIIEDNGCGFGENKCPPGRRGHGLENLRKRTESLGGQINISSRAGAGTKLALHIPLAAKTGSKPSGPAFQ